MFKGTPHFKYQILIKIKFMSEEFVNCPIESTLNLINRKWVIILIRDMFIGKKHFSEFKNSNPNLNSNVLSHTLRFMEDNDLILKTSSDDGATSYSLTEKGKKLNQIMYQMVVYGLDVLMDNGSDCDDLKDKYKKILEVWILWKLLH